MSLAYNIAQSLYQGKIEGTGNGGHVTCCPVHGDKHPSMSIWDDGKGGITVDCKTGCSWKEIKDKLVEMGHLPAFDPKKKNNNRTTKTAPKPEEKKPAAPEKDSFIWDQASKKGIEHAKKYFANRAITLDLPVCIRWNSYKDKTGNIQNMVVAAASKPGETSVKAVQRLYIDTDDHTKYDAKMYGNMDGRGVWMNRKGDMTEIIISEGIETVLSAMQATGKNGVAALSTSGLKGLVIPEETETIYILVDSDPVRENPKASMPGQKAAYIKAEDFERSREGRKAFLVLPDPTCFSDNPKKLDFNDRLKEDPTGESIRSRFEKAVKLDALEWSPPGLDEEENEAPENNVLAEEAMFERFVFLASENKIVDTIGHDIKQAMMIERAFILSQAGHFHHYEDADGNQKTMPLTKHWLLSENKKIASEMDYCPGLPLFFLHDDGRYYYNTFRLPYQDSPPLPDHELEERLKPWHKIMDTVFHKHRSYIEDWFSFSIQQPQERTGIMPVCISGVGLGKSLVMAIISRVIGHQNFSNGKILDVTGLGRTGTQWGDWIFNKKISCIEEIDPEGESSIAYKILDALKDIITNETLSLNLKGGRNGTFQVYSNIIGFSNHPNCVKIPYGDRRLFIVDSTGQTILDSHEYKEIWDWMRDPQNIKAVFQYLIAREISEEFIPGQAKMTTAKKNLQIDGRSDLQTAFDLVVEQYPSDLVTAKELGLAVSQALNYIEGGEGLAQGENWNADKQYKAILRTTTTLAAGGKRLRVQRIGGSRLNPSLIRAIRNGQKWQGATNQEVVDAMYVETPLNWIKEEDDDTAPF